MLFSQNKYTTWYYNIISYALTHPMGDNTYSEKHHIIPRSLGGNDSPENLVRLTARQHFVCHILLTKMTTGQNQRKMIHAAIGMKRARAYQQRYVNSRLYETVRKQYAQLASLYNAGRVPTAETRAKMSAAGKGRPKSKEHAEKISKALKGKLKGPMREDLKQQISNTVRGTKSTQVQYNKGKKGLHKHSDEAKAKIAESNRRRGCSEETRAKIAASVKANNERKKMLALT